MNSLPRASFSSSAKTMGASWPNIIFIPAMATVLYRICPKSGIRKIKENHSSPTKLEWSIPLAGMKFWKAMTTPYIGA
ncbi:hypothetical protein D3C76_1492310 [compost metagenome]